MSKEPQSESKSHPPLAAVVAVVVVEGGGEGDVSLGGGAVVRGSAFVTAQPTTQLRVQSLPYFCLNA